MQDEITLEITPQLQDQIRWLCDYVHDVEWSGTLFYTTEGEFGKPDFKCIAQYIFLQDIGSAAYTEYEFDESYVAFLMENPILLDMNKGHIHSHNKMNVFFSGTDTSEIHDNSEFHNYYLSLIVNNQYEMCAKIAFRMKETRDIKSKVHFKGTNGKQVERFVTATEEAESVGVYDCDILVPENVSDNFINRYEQVRIANEEKKKQSKTMNTWHRGSWKDRPYNGVDISGSATQANLFEEGASSKDFLRAVLDQDENSTKTLAGLLHELNEDFIHSITNALSLDEYCTIIGESIDGMYDRIFPFSVGVTMFSVLTECIEYLREYEEQYPLLIQDLIAEFEEALEFYTTAADNSANNFDDEKHWY